MDPGTVVAVGFTAAVGLAFVGVAAASLRPESRFRRWYGVDPSDDEAVRSNAVVVGASGVGLLALAAAIAGDASERAVGTAAVLVSAGLCVGLGWLVRYRDRRALLATPGVDRETARRLGGAVIVTGLFVLPLAPAIWFGFDAAAIAAIGLGGAVASLFVLASAYR